MESQLAGCPMMSSIAGSMSEEAKKEMLAKYEQMVKAGQHSTAASVSLTSNQPSGPRSGEPGSQTVSESAINEDETGASSDDDIKAMQSAHNAIATNPSRGQVMGCPFFNKDITDPQGKNITPGYPLKYVSKFEFIFKGQGRSARRIKKEETQFVDSLPYLIKHTLLLDSDMMGKMRTLSDFSQLFFISDDTKIKGNKKYDQGHYYQALDVYEQVVGCYLWLEFNSPDLKDKIMNDLDNVGIRDVDVDLREKPIIREEDRDIETETNQSMTVGTIVNAMLAYMSVFHFDEAMKCADLILDQFFKDSEIYFRKAQITFFNKNSTIAELNESIELLKEHCLNSKKEKKVLDKYFSLEESITKEIKRRIKREVSVVSSMLKRAEKIIAGLKLKQKSGQPKLKDIWCKESDDTYQVMTIMNEKYGEIVSFFRDANNEQTLQNSIIEYQYFAKIYSELRYALEFDPAKLPLSILDGLDKELRDVAADPRMSEVLPQVRLDFSDSIFFHASELNQQVYQHAWDLLQEKKQKQAAKEEEKKEKSNPNGLDKKTNSILPNSKFILVNSVVFFTVIAVLVYLGYGVEFFSGSGLLNSLNEKQQL